MVTGSSGADPEQLQQAGLEFQQASNVFYGMADSKDLQSGGKLEIDILDLMTGRDELPAQLGTEIQKVTQDFLGVVIDAQMQMADAAMDLFQCANDFKTADGVIPSGATRIKDTDPSIAAYYDQKTRQTYYKDKDGTVIEVPGTQKGGSQLGQTYQPSTSS